MLICIQRKLSYKLEDDLSDSEKNEKVFTIELAKENDKDIIQSRFYRSVSGESENLSLFLQNIIIQKSFLDKKISYILDYFSMNYLSYHYNTKRKDLYTTIFERGAITIINCPTRISEISASIIDILTID